MRLLNSQTFELKEFSESVPEYAILSHTWSDSEVTFQDVQSGKRHNEEAFTKVRHCCEQAYEDGYGWVWVDTCCIDKTSSAELSEAINSMFKWYAESSVCYVYLSDVPVPSPHFPETEFRAARWFTRGWCLQELIAPRHVVFYAAQWTDIGTKESLMDLIHDITGIDKKMLGDPDDDHQMSFLAREVARRSHSQRCADRLSQYSAAERMSWASARKTSRTEDIAYSLLGIFQINMPLLYGEGSKAFYRLQEEIMRHNTDLSLLLWCTKSLQSETFLSDQESTEFSVLASSPEFFRRQGLALSLQKDCRYYELASTAHSAWPDQHVPLRPAQLIGGGLYVQMAVGRSKRTRNRRSLIAWTGFECIRGYVCIELLPVAWSKASDHGDRNPNMYGRHGTSRVVLLNEEEYSQLHILEMHLSLKSVSTELFAYLKGIIRAPNTPPDLIIKLPFSETEKILFVDSFPRLSFNVIQDEPKEYSHQPRGFSQLYSNYVNASHFERYEVLQLKFSVSMVTAKGLSSTYMVIDLALRYNFLRCRVTQCSFDDSLEERLGMKGSLGRNFHSSMHERATCKLSDGSVLYVIAKTSRQALSGEQQRRLGPAAYNIEMIVRPSVIEYVEKQLVPPRKRARMDEDNLRNTDTSA